MDDNTMKVGTWPTPEVRIRIPARAAYDLGSLQTVVENLAERLGCPKCLSGAHCLFTNEQEFVVLPDLSVEEDIGPRR
jgi:hypothetical protein